MITPKKKQIGTSERREKLNNDAEFSVSKVHIMTLDFLIHVSGLVPPNNATPLIRFLYKVFLTMIFPLYTLALLGQVMAVYVHWGNIPVISTIMSYMSGLLLSVISCIYFLHNKDKFMRLVGLLRTEFLANTNSKYIKFIHLAERQIKLSTTLSAPIAIALGTISIVVPFLNKNTASNLDNNNVTSDASNLDRLMLVMWFPFSIEESPQFEIIMVLQMIVICFSILMLTAVDVIFLSLLSHAAAQFKVLCAMLNDMHENISEDELNRTKHKSPLHDIADFNLMKDPLTSANNIMSHGSGSGNCGRPSSETRQENCHVNRDAFRLYLAECIKYHQAVIGFVDNLNEIVSFVTSLKIVNFPPILCMTGFEMTQSFANHEQFLKFASLFAISLFLIAGYCWFGQQVIDEVRVFSYWYMCVVLYLSAHNNWHYHSATMQLESEKVQLAFYSTDWYNQTPGFKRLLPLAIMRASRPVKVKAGVFYDLSFLTLASLVNASYRFFTMLIQLHDS